MICNKCGAQIPEGSIFCTNCGSIVEVPTSENSLEQGFNTENNFQNNMAFSNDNEENINTFNESDNFENNIQSDYNNINTFENNNGQNFNNMNTESSFNNYSGPIYNHNEEKPKKEINFKLIGLIVGIIVVIGVAILIALPFISSANEKKQVKNIEGLKVYIPESFVTNNDGQYDASYGEKDDSLMVALKTFDNSAYNTNDYSNAFVEMMNQKGYKCDASSSKSINKNKWQYTKCEYLGAKMYIYITTKEEKLYVLLAGATKQAGDKGTKYLEKVEKYLNFASDTDI